MSRRSLFGWGLSGAAAVTVAPPTALFARAGRFPPDVGSKFDENGIVAPFAGNTIVCHLPQQGVDSSAFGALLDIYRDTPKHKFMRKVALLPPSSYHMTVFGAANDRSRSAVNWPSDLPLDMPMSECNNILGQRLRKLRLYLELPISMKIDPNQKPENGKPLIFLLRPADQAEADKLTYLRETFSTILKIRPPSFDAYRFHVTLGYPLRWFDPAEQREFEDIWDSWASEIASRAPIISLGPPEYCTFKDMYAFNREFFIGQAE